MLSAKLKAVSRSRFARLLRDRRGVAAVEFAIIVPVMLIFYLGMFEASHALVVKRKVDNAAETVGGIVARSTEMSDTRLRNILMISDAIVGDAGGVPEITITTVKTDDKGVATRDWERIGTASGAAKGTPYPLPSDLTGLNDAYFVFAKVRYQYVPTFDVGGIFGAIEFERTFSYRPRKGDSILWK